MASAAYLFGFAGRFRRRDFWYIYILLNFYGLAASVLALAISHDPDSMTYGIISDVLALPMLVTLAAALTKRLHDHDVSGWWLLAYFALFLVAALAMQVIQNHFGAGGTAFAIALPFVAPPAILGGWWFFRIGFFRGTQGDNRYGPDPLAGPK